MHINELGPPHSFEKLQRMKIRVTLVHKKGPLVLKQRDQDEPKSKFYKFLFADGTGQIDCLVDDDYENAETLYERLEVGRNYKVEDFYVTEVTGQSVIYNLSEHIGMIKNPGVVSLFNGIIHGLEEKRNVQFHLKTFTEVIDTSEKFDLVDVIGKVISIDKIDRVNKFKEITIQTLDAEDDESYRKTLTVVLWGNNRKLVKVAGGIVVFKKAEVRQWEWENNKLYVTQGTSTFKIKTQEDLRHLPNETVLKWLDCFVKLPSLTDQVHVNMNLISTLIKNARLETLSLVKNITKSNITSSVTLTLPGVTVDYRSYPCKRHLYATKIPNNIILTDEPSLHRIRALWEFSSEEAIEQINDCLHGPVVCRVTIKMKKNQVINETVKGDLSKALEEIFGLVVS